MPDVLCRGWQVAQRRKTRVPLFTRCEPGQPLMLHREPENPADPNAILVCDLFGEPLTYMDRRRAVVWAPKLDAGELWLARVRFVIEMHMRDMMIRLWRDHRDALEDTTVYTGTLLPTFDVTSLEDA